MKTLFSSAARWLSTVFSPLQAIALSAARIAAALERLAAAAEAPLPLDGPEPVLIEQTDEELARLEQLDARRRAGGYVADEEYQEIGVEP